MHPLWTMLEHKAQTLGFDKIGLLDVSQGHPALERAGEYLQQWLARGYQADMNYMEKHGVKRFRPAELEPHTTAVLAVRMHYLTDTAQQSAQAVLNDDQLAAVSCYALGRDYHKTMRSRLKQLASWLSTDYVKQLQDYGLGHNTDHAMRVFVDSAPVMEKATAQAAGLGWIGKHTLLLDQSAGSYFFLGEIYTNLPIPTQAHESAQIHQPAQANRCGRCQRCIEICPTQAIRAPYQLDARRCISYLTIENKGAIPIEFREAIGNRIFGCDDCQLVCPWNRFAKLSQEADFRPRAQLQSLALIDAISWTSADFDRYSAGSPIRRATYYGWLRNLAVALGNARASAANRLALTQCRSRLQADSNERASMVIEHIEWALARQNQEVL